MLDNGLTPPPVLERRQSTNLPVSFSKTPTIFKDTDYAVGLFNIERAGHVYSRLSNPTNAVLEERIAALDNGVGGIATASG